MNQDSDQNEPRRDGERRSFGRREDDRQGDSERPRFNRDAGPRDAGPRDANDRPRYGQNAGTPDRGPQNRDNDRPRFDRDRSAGPRNRDGGPAGPSDRPERKPQNRDNDRPRSFDRNDRPAGPNPRPSFGRDRTDDRPRFDRRDDSFRERRNSDAGDNRRDAGPRNRDGGPARSGNNDRPRFGGPAGTPPANRGPRDFDQRRPRFGDNQSNDRFKRNTESGERPFRDRAAGTPDRGSPDRDRREQDTPFRSRDERPRRDTGTPPANRPDRGSRDRDDRSAGAGSRPSFNRSRDDDRPRFDRSSGPAGARDRDSRDQTNDRPRSFDRDSRDARKDKDGGSRPRFDRDRSAGPRNRDGGPAGSGNSDRPGRNGGSDKPGFERVGGFSPEADERNRFGSSDRSTQNRPDNERSESGRFSPEQRKDSGDRRTGRYEKSPDYSLNRERGLGNRNSGPRRDRDDRATGPQSRDVKPKRTAADNESDLTRLNRYIANSGVCSRREADELIARGDISVNGKVVTEMGYKVKPGDVVKHGTKVLNPERLAYVLLNKPKDYLTTTEDPEERRTVMELVADAGNFRLYPVGRLDRNTTGLLILTNDGELADKLTHPSNNVRKIYQVELDKPITDEHFEALQQGIELEDGPIKPDALSIVTPDAYVIGIEIHSGRNRIVRRMFEHFGYEVSKLDRTTFAGLTKKDLPRGKWRFLDPKEVVKLKYFNN